MITGRCTCTIILPLLVALLQLASVDAGPSSLRRRGQAAEHSSSPSEDENWYPDWHGKSNQCKNDDAPAYMQKNVGYYEKSLEDCCERYFSWDYYTCTGALEAAGSLDEIMGYYPNWGEAGTKCSNSVNSMPKYMQTNPDIWIHDDIETCCKNYFGYALGECISSSGGEVLTSGKWYVNYKRTVCQMDCINGGGACGGIAHSWDELYDSAGECCKEKLFWIPKSDCESESTAAVESGPAIQIRIDSVVYTVDATTLGVSVPCPLPTVGSELTSLVNTLKDAIEGKIRANLDEDQTVLDITIVSVCGTILNMRRGLLTGQSIIAERSLAATDVEYKATIEYSCISVECSNSASEVREAAELSSGESGNDSSGGNDAGGESSGTDPCADVTCTPLDQCHDAGTCDSANGSAVCSNPLKSDGTSCDDGDASTGNDVCTNGVCAGLVSIVTYPSELPYSTPLTNPERGFYTQYTYRASSPSRLDVSSLDANRVSTGQSVILRLYYLDEFIDGPISQSVLNDVLADFESMRAAG
jgi:hypothetical protein